MSKKVINIYIYFLHNESLVKKYKHTLNNCLFVSVKLTKNAYPDKYKYSSYDIGFDSRSEYSFTDGSMGKNVVIFGSDMNSSVHIVKNNKKIYLKSC